MSEVEFIKWAMLAMLSVGGFFMKRTLDRLESEQKEAKNEIAKIKEDYLHKNDFKDFKIELRSMFEEIRKDIRELHK